MKVHYTHNYLLNPQHMITVALAGVGGTGSQLLAGLARINHALVALGHPGIHVCCYDPDMVTEANIGRQLYSQADIGLNKAVVSVTRINRYFGLDWEASPQTMESPCANIVATCIDTAKGRLDIGGFINKNKDGIEPYEKRYYWLDLGNLRYTGQAVLGTIQHIKQPKSDFETAGSLPTVVQKFPQLKKIKEKDQGASCSLAEAINKQDLFINSTLAQFGANLLWKLFREGMIRYHGCYLNLETLSVNPIKIQ